MSDETQTLDQAPEGAKSDDAYPVTDRAVEALNNGQDPADTINQALQKISDKEAELLEREKALDEREAILDKMGAAVPAAAIVAQPGHRIIFVSSKVCESKPGPHPVTGKEAAFVSGSVNGEEFCVLCDEAVEVPDHVAEALSGVTGERKY